jgi:electron transport complex protein RnfC
VGLDVENSGHLSVIDGGPYLNEMGIEELGTEDGYIRQTTNALLLIPKGTKSKDYADVETEPPEEGIISLVGEISGVRMPLGGRHPRSQPRRLSPRVTRSSTSRR